MKKTNIIQGMITKRHFFLTIKAFGLKKAIQSLFVKKPTYLEIMFADFNQ